MEKAVGIVAEFNPFHQGHEYLIRRVKERFPQKAVVCMMSGNFVQRGSFAIQEKYSRAVCAIKGGADLVLELPFPFSSLSAEAFAHSAVYLLSAIGACDTLAFGSEIPDSEMLCECAKNLMSPSFLEEKEAYLAAHKGEGYPMARQTVYEKLFGPTPILSHPNASLAIEYLIWNQRLARPMAVYPVERRTKEICSAEEKLFASACQCRTWVRENQWQELYSSVPSYTAKEIDREREAGRFPVWEESLSPVLFYLLRSSTRRELSQWYGFAPLCDRATRLANGCRSLEELIRRMGTSGYTDSRIRRSLLALLLQIPRYAERSLPSYTMVLAANQNGRNLLSHMRKASSVPVFTKPSHALKHSDPLLCRQASAAALADRTYLSAFPRCHEEGFFIKKNPYME